MLNNPTLYSVIYDVTGTCNYRCIYCRNDWTNSESEKQASLELIHQTVDRIADSGAKRIIYTGGEFFLLPQWREVLAYSQSKGLKNRIITNASLVKPEDIPFLETHIEQINVSFHTAKRLLYNKIMGIDDESVFNNVVNNLKAISDSTIRLGLFYSPLKSNFDQLFNTIEYLVDSGIQIDELNLNRIIPAQHSLEYFQQTPQLNKCEHIFLIRQVIDIRKTFHINAFVEAYPVCFLRTFIDDELIDAINIPCLVGRKVIALNNDGSMKLCPATGFRISEPIQNLLSDFDTNPTVRQFQSGLWRNNKCHNCPDWQICYGACHASRGELFADDSLFE